MPRNKSAPKTAPLDERADGTALAPRLNADIIDPDSTACLWTTAADEARRTKAVRDNLARRWGF